MAKARVIEKIEGLRPELQLQSLVDRELPPDGKVHLPGPEAAHEIAGCIATRAASGRTECSRIERPPTRILRPVDVNRHTRDEVKPGVDYLPRSRVYQ